MNQPNSAFEFEAPRSRTGADGPRILIVDDREDNAMLLERLLGSMGYRHVRVVFDSRLAMHSIASFHPHLLFLDINMPHINGFEILEAVRRYGDEFQTMPIIITSADDSPEVRAKAMSLGATDIFHTFVIDELAEKVAKYLGSSAERKAG